MTREIINSSRVTPMRSAVNHAVKSGGFVFVTGVTPFRGAERMTATIDKGDLVAQIHQVMKNMQAILEEAGTSLDRAVKMNIALTDMSRYAEFDATFRTYFAEGNFPARQTTESARLAHPDFLVSIDCIAEA
ncbi:RidA family protein [Roseomonas sp. HJA6]|uniref:RidA family protein n=1 Tax=Roseomonas alba TaxID=2846776 RepID=A0ABS7A3K9_9PROT|nr:RidA family protein [Neoroseomonas alba]MBW6396873.1 RidA family protein [Neoroseomonas alba]